MLNSSPVEFELDAADKAVAFTVMGQEFTRVDPAAAAAVLPLAMSNAARSTERYGAVDALPAAIALPSALR